MSLNERNQSAWCFSHNVRYLREKKGLTQEELAADSGVSVNEISKVERRLVIPRLNMVDHIANAFGLPAGRMLDPYLDRQAEFPREGGHSAGYDCRAGGTSGKGTGISLRPD